MSKVKFFLATPLLTALVLILAVVAAVAGPVGTAFGWELSAQCGPNGTVVGTTTVPIDHDHHGDPIEKVFEIVAQFGNGQNVPGSRQTITTKESVVAFTLNVSAANGQKVQVHLSSGETTNLFGPCLVSTPTATATATSTNTATKTATLTPTNTSVPPTRTPRPNTATATPVPPTATSTRAANTPTTTPFIRIDVPAQRCPTICLPNTGDGSNQEKDEVMSTPLKVTASAALTTIIFVILAFAWLVVFVPNNE